MRPPASQLVTTAIDGDRDDAEHQRRRPVPPRGDDVVAGQRPVPGAAHDRVDVAVDVAVQRVGTARGQRAADQRRDDDATTSGRPPAARIMAGSGGDQQQLDDPRLGQRDVGRERPECADADRGPVRPVEIAGRGCG